VTGSSEWWWLASGFRSATPCSTAPSIIMLEHVIDLERVLAESSRVLDEGVLWLALTPNRNRERLLDLELLSNVVDKV
jgi:hypothetical protein